MLIRVKVSNRLNLSVIGQLLSNAQQENIFDRTIPFRWSLRTICIKSHRFVLRKSMRRLRDFLFWCFFLLVSLSFALHLVFILLSVIRYLNVKNLVHLTVTAIIGASIRGFWCDFITFICSPFRMFYFFVLFVGHFKRFYCSTIWNWSLTYAIIYKINIEHIL